MDAARGQARREAGMSSPRTFLTSRYIPAHTAPSCHRQGGEEAIGGDMKTNIILVSTVLASAVLALSAGTASAQPWRGGDAIPMRDGSTIITLGSCLVQYGRRNERIN